MNFLGRRRPVVASEIGSFVSPANSEVGAEFGSSGSQLGDGVLIVSPIYANCGQYG